MFFSLAVVWRAPMLAHEQQQQMQEFVDLQSFWRLGTSAGIAAVEGQKHVVYVEARPQDNGMNGSCFRRRTNSNIWDPQEECVRTYAQAYATTVKLYMWVCSLGPTNERACYAQV